MAGIQRLTKVWIDPLAVAVGLLQLSIPELVPDG